MVVAVAVVVVVGVVVVAVVVDGGVDGGVVVAATVRQVEQFFSTFRLSRIPEKAKKLSR